MRFYHFQKLVLTPVLSALKLKQNHGSLGDNCTKLWLLFPLLIDCSDNRCFLAPSVSFRAIWIHKALVPVFHKYHSGVTVLCNVSVTLNHLRRQWQYIYFFFKKWTVWKRSKNQHLNPPRRLKAKSLHPYMDMHPNHFLAQSQTDPKARPKPAWSHPKASPNQPENSLKVNLKQTQSQFGTSLKVSSMPAQSQPGANLLKQAQS